MRGRSWRATGDQQAGTGSAWTTSRSGMLESALRDKSAIKRTVAAVQFRKVMVCKLLCLYAIWQFVGTGYERS